MRVFLFEGLSLAILALVGIVEGLATLNRVSFQREPLTAGWYLVGVSTALFACACLYLVIGRPRAAAELPATELRSGMGIAVWGVMMGYALLMPLLGYALATLLFFTAVFYLLKIRPWLRAGLVGLLFAATFFLAFVWLANLQMPTGLVGLILDWLF